MKNILRIIVIYIFLIETVVFGAEKILIKTDGKIIRATLNESRTSKEFSKLLPLELHMNNWDDREFYGKLPEKLFNGEKELETYSNGDVTYFSRGNSFAVFYDKDDISKQSGLIKIGEITSDLSVFKTLPKNIKVYIEKEN